MDDREENERFKTKEYWEERYQSDKGLYEWFKGYSDLKEFLNKIIKKTDSILHVGCGNSGLTLEMYNDGFHNITNNDFSEVVINDMISKSKDKPEMRWDVMDVKNMTYPNETFDVCIDKGTMDALVCDVKDVWNPEEEVMLRAHLMCTEVSRVLKPQGIYIQITFTQPHFRRKFLERAEYNWTFESNSIGEAFHYFIYVMRKH